MNHATDTPRQFLASFIRGHEKALAESHHFPPRTRPVTAPAIKASNPVAPRPSTSGASAALYSTLSIPTLGLASSTPKPARLFLTPNQTYYLLSRFEELGVDPGPRNIRLENIHAEASSSNYVSFLQNALPTPKARRGSDQISIQSVSSVRSTMSSMWSSLSASLSGGIESRRTKQKAVAKEDLRYLYSAFTKIPHLKLAMDHRIRRIQGYEEFPFDSAVPLWVFKNICDLEIIDVDYRSFYGWDRLADQLRSLTLKRAGLDDIEGLLTSIVLDDMDRRRRRTSKNTASPIGYPSPGAKYAELARSQTSPDTPVARSRPLSGDVSKSLEWSRPPLTTARTTPRPRRRPERRDSAHLDRVAASASSPDTSPEGTPRNSSSHLPGLGILPSNKWQFLRHLGLADNGLTHMTAESLVPIMTTLTSLDLSFNHFVEVPDALSSLVSLRSVNLSHCMIDSLRSLSKTPLPAITVLALRNNRISSLAGIESLVSLERLDLRENRLTDPTELARLTRMPEFRDVYVSKNPFTSMFESYRVTIFNLFRSVPGYLQDVTIDSSGPSSSEKRLLADRAADRPQQPGPNLIQHEVVVMPISSGKNDNQVTICEAPINLPDAAMAEHAHRKKLPKRRVVDVAESHGRSLRRDDDVPPPPPPKDPDYVGTLKNTHKSSHAAGSAAAGSVEPDSAQSRGSPIHASTDRGTPTSMKTGGSSLTSLDAPSFSGSSDMYRKRIEELKQNFGSDWLNMLGDAQTSPISPRAMTTPASPETLSGRAIPQLTPAAVVSSGKGLS